MSSELLGLEDQIVVSVGGHPSKDQLDSFRDEYGIQPGDGKGVGE